MVRIGELSAKTGVSTRALRYYEQQGLIRSRRLPNGYRDYGPQTVDVVLFVQDLFAVGLPSRLLRDIIPCVAEGGTSSPPEDLLARVMAVRDDLLRQEHRLRERRKTLDDYLAGRLLPSGANAVHESQSV
ncbi:MULTISPECIES: MerR family DNA-binding transcriptional regulator [unclassified Leifsonia]|uniref:MerR family DNA-binding transcriptional regulator n=1 Tax=unclassified Leifsonia TaxID=2663824 RepID=UPI001E3AE05A|nr:MULTISPECIES: MerR family DNA-binding transcriptional regulator [unclassified Leifsonia]